jgi:hypothetical protein
MYLNETCSKIWMGTNIADTFPIQNALKGDIYRRCFSALL